MAKKVNITDEEFERILEDILGTLSAEELLHLVPGIGSEVREYFNNEVIERWEEQQE